MLADRLGACARLLLCCGGLGRRGRVLWIFMRICALAGARTVLSRSCCAPPDRMDALDCHALVLAAARGSAGRGTMSLSGLERGECQRPGRRDEKGRDCQAAARGAGAQTSSGLTWRQPWQGLSFQQGSGLLLQEVSCQPGRRPGDRCAPAKC